MSIVKASNFSILIFTALCFSCNNDDVGPVIDNQMNIDVDGEAYASINEKIGGNENCNQLYVSTSYYDENKIYFTVDFSFSKEGQLMRVMYGEYTLPMTTSQIKKIFVTPNFNPLSTFDISEFYYNANTGEVKFNFAGTVYYESDNKVVRNISGEIKIKSLRTTECIVSNTGLSYSSNDLNLFSISNNRTKYSDETQTHRFFSNNGYVVYMHLSGDLWNYPVGEIEFNEEDLQDKVVFTKAVGAIAADQLQNINSQIWKIYATSGKIIVENKYVEYNQKVISGKLLLTIKVRIMFTFLNISS